jgi:hypothetical protein
MNTVVCFDNLKQAALLYDKVLPISFQRMAGTGTDIVFEFPELIPSRAIIDIVFDDPSINELDKSRYNAIGRIVDNWSLFTNKIRGYEYGTTKSSLDESYEKLKLFYLENKTQDELGPIRIHFMKYAKSLGIRSTDILLPSSVGYESQLQEEQLALTLSGIPLIDHSSASWEQIVEVRRDLQSRKQLQRFRLYLAKNYSGKSTAYIEDDISVALEDYELAKKKHGFDTLVSSLSVLLNSKNIQAAGVAGIGAAFFGGINAGLSSALAVELGKFTIEFSKKHHAMKCWEKSHELAYLIDVNKKL